MKIVLLFLVFSLVNASSLANKKPYIVYMGAHSHGPDATKQDFDRVTDSHHRFLATFLGSHEEAKNAIFDSYTRHINGFAAFLDEHQAADIAKHPDVVSVFRNNVKKLHTTHSWDFMRLEYKGQPTLPWIVSRFGEDIIIGNLDTGVWPESKSFSDEGYGPVPARWKGECEHTNVTHGVHCNRKLIGARHFNKGYKADGNKVDPSMESARDFDGHGSHTLSTAGGNFVGGVSINNISLGTIKGGSPRARVASYKICWLNDCRDSDVMAAFDMAIHDGVDILSLSLGGIPVDFFQDGISIGAFHAVQKGIVVVCSAGNGNTAFPFPYYVSNAAPWIITVAASTMDREFSSSVQLGNGHILKGLSLSNALPKYGFYPLISAADAKLANVSASDALFCKKNTLDEKKLQGKIVACIIGDSWDVEKGLELKLAGAAGMILCNNKYAGDSIEAELHFLPSTYVGYEDSLTLFKYINSTKEPTAYLTPPTPNFDVKPAPRIASFSSRGPNVITPEILKPDITAPGVNVIAAFSPAASPTELPFDHRKLSYMMASGTSMSCPHVSGVAGLLKTLYPTWSPAAIRSAMMTSAKTRDNTYRPMLAYDSDPIEEGTPFDYGAGHLRPTQALNPGLIYDLTPTDYLDFLCGIGYSSSVIEKFHHGSHKCSKSSSNRTSLLNFNYPSITVFNLNDTVTATRTVTNVGYPGTYYAHIRQPKGVSVTVKPNTLKFNKIGEKKKFEVTLTLKGKVKVPVDHRFGELLWSNEEHHVKSPIVAYWH